MWKIGIAHKFFSLIRILYFSSIHTEASPNQLKIFYSSFFFREDLVACSSVNSVNNVHDMNTVSSSSSSSSPLFVALYDFHGVGEEQLSLRKGDQVSALS